MAIEVSFHPEAVRELRAAFLWYYDRNPIVAQSFQAETEHAIEIVLEDPRRWPKWGITERKYRQQAGSTGRSSAAPLNSNVMCTYSVHLSKAI